MPTIVSSRNGIRVRLTDERWAHIVNEHAELAGLRPDVLTAVGQPERVVAGYGGELLAVRTLEPGKCIVAVYRELEHDGFVITAFVTRRLASLDRRKQIWP